MVVFTVIDDLIGECPLNATNEDEVVAELYAQGFVNLGDVTVIRKEYTLSKVEEYFFDTDYDNEL